MEREKEQLIQDMKRLEQEAKEWDMIHQEVKQDRSRAGKIKGLILTKHIARSLNIMITIC